MVGRRHVAFLYASLLSGPRAVAAGGGLVAVTESKFTDRRVTVLDAATGAIVSVLGECPAGK